MDSAEVLKLLEPKQLDAIIDIKLSNDHILDEDLLHQGYHKVGSYGRSQSIWIWRRKQGTCCGRLKPVIDLQLEKSKRSSVLSLSGYTCLLPGISGQYLWIKRSSHEEEEKDSIVDLYITTGKMKEAADPIWIGPGVGWIRVDGNFNRGILNSYDSFLWFLPARTRSMELHMSSPIRNAIIMSEETRKSSLVTAVRIALRRYIPTREMKRMSTFMYPEVGGGSLTIVTHIRDDDDEVSLSASQSRRVYDFSAFYHSYDYKGTNKISKSVFSKILLDVGVAIDSGDLARCFHHIDINQNSYISREEYCLALSLTDHEIDVLVDLMRDKLMQIVRRTSKLKHNWTLSEIFRVINTNQMGFLSLTELLNLLGRLELFVSEEEGRKVLKLMDLDGDDRVEKKDFVGFLRKSSNTSVRKAHRLREAAELFRRWLIRGTAHPGSQRGSATGVSVAASQWEEMKNRHVVLSGKKFPGFIVADDLMLNLNILGMRLSVLETKELCLIIAPSKRGRIQQGDLDAYASRTCRPFGALLALLERDILKPVVDAYREYRRASSGPEGEDAEKAAEYKGMLKEIVAAVHEAAPSDSQERGRGDTSQHEVVAVAQVKRGIESVMRGYETPDALLPNEEEWACLACLAGAGVADEETHGIAVYKMLDNLNSMIVDGMDTRSVGGGKASLEAVKSELQQKIREDATTKDGNGHHKDYAAVFQLFDVDKKGAISIEDFRSALLRLHLVDHLSAEDLPALLALFDERKTGKVTLKSFIEFAEKGAPFADDDDEDEDDEEDSDDLNILSVDPPVVITRNKDCDLLLWFLWKQCCKQDPMDPESLVTELQACCCEAELTEKAESVSVKDLWFILGELRLRGDLTRSQFDKGIQYLCGSRLDTAGGEKSKKKGADGGSVSGAIADGLHVDYETLCRNVVRMGRSFNEKLQERRKEEEHKFRILWAALRKELLGSGSSGGSKGSLHFEKIFRRLDTDGDGHLTVKEFKRGLKRMHCVDERKWTLRMIRRLFDERGGGKEGTILLADFSALVRQPTAGEPEKGEDSEDGKSEDEGETIFTNSRHFGDADLMRKAAAALMESVPRSDRREENHLDTVKAAVKRYFSRSDPDGKGLVREERFRSFLRSSGIQSRFTATEVRRLLELLRRRVPLKGGGTGGTMIDYDRFCRQLLSTADHLPASVPLSKAEATLTKLQQACSAASASGRPFLALCSLVDGGQSGKLSVGELCVTCKMMGCKVAPDEINALKDLLPDHAISSDGSINYNDLNLLIMSYMPHVWRHTDTSSVGGKGHIGALPIYAHPGMTTMLPDPSKGFDMSRSILTPGGYYVLAPAPEKKEEKKEEKKPEAKKDKVAYDKMVLALTARVKLASEEKSRVWGTSFSLRRQFQVFDTDKSGWLTVATFQNSLSDIGIELTAEELHAIKSQFGRGEDDKLSYENFCSAILGDRPKDSTYRHGFAGLSLSRSSIRTHDAVREAREVFSSQDKFRRGLYIANKTPLLPSDVACIVTQVDYRLFEEVILDFKLVSDERDARRASEEYASLADRSLVCYEDFLGTITPRGFHSSGGFGTFEREHGHPFGRRGTDTSVTLSPIRRGAGGPRDHPDDIDHALSLSSPLADRWYAEDASPKQRRDYDRVYQSINRFKHDMASSDDGRQRASSNRALQIDVDEGASEYGIPPPKPSDSVQMARRDSGRWNYGGEGGQGRAIAESSYYDDYGVSTPRAGMRSRPLSGRDLFSARYTSQNGLNAASPSRGSGAPTPRSSSRAAPRSPPSKVGAAMWGSDTPLANKGQPPRIDDGKKWCCAVCYYTENSNNSAQCELCDSQNYNKNKDYQVKLQCSNCTFLNGNFAVKCEMCGQSLQSKAKR